MGEESVGIEERKDRNMSKDKDGIEKRGKEGIGGREVGRNRR